MNVLRWSEGGIATHFLQFLYSFLELDRFFVEFVYELQGLRFLVLDALNDCSNFMLNLSTDLILNLGRIT